MSQDDPFAAPESERTIIIPTPSARGGGRPAAAGGAGPFGSTAEPVRETAAVALAGVNPLVAAANPLLDMVPQLRASLDHPDPERLRDRLVADIETFERDAAAAGVATNAVKAARYVLCTLLDEVAASTPWGSAGVWPRHSLLVRFHNEAWGGEKFFQLLSKLAEDPAGNRDLLELMYVCLALGFEGRYHVVENGRAQLDTLTERLAALIRKQRGDYERDLSPQWRGAPQQQRRLFTVLPLWVAAAVIGALLVALYIGFNYSLNVTSDRVFGGIQALRVESPKPAPLPAAAPARPRLAPLLPEDIARGLIDVRDEADRSVVVVHGDGLFEPGSVTVNPEIAPMLVRVGRALATLPGKVLVTGHTDNQPIRSVRFPSNWHLSEERARSVARLLVENGTAAERIRSEGRADEQPVAPNDTPANRAKNRRVEIVLRTAGGG